MQEGKKDYLNFLARHLQVGRQGVQYLLRVALYLPHDTVTRTFQTALQPSAPTDT